MFTSILLVFVSLLLLELFRRRKNDLQFFDRLGVPGPKPNIFWGHYDKFRSAHIDWLDRWSKEYGDTYGIYLGAKPVLVSSDPEFAQYVMVKNFSNFADRASLFVLEKSDPNIAEMVSLVQDETWRRQRKLITSAFTTKNSKELLPLINRGADDLLKGLDSRQDKRFNIMPLVIHFAIDNIALTIFGLEPRVQKHGDALSIVHQLHKASVGQMSGLLDLLANSFDLVGVNLSSAIHFLIEKRLVLSPYQGVADEILEIIKHRRTGTRKNDLLQRFIDANNDENLSEGKKLYLTNSELLSNALGMFIVGFETTTYTLGYLIYCLGRHPEVQEKLREEITDTFGLVDTCDVSVNEDDYFKVMRMKYLDAVIKETLRLYPTATGFTTRKALAEFTYDSKVYPAGLEIMFAPSVIQRDAKNWSDPLLFKPERFDVESGEGSHPLAYQAFGEGPRNCVGMKLALMSIKVLLIRVLSVYRIQSFGEPKRISKAVLSTEQDIEVIVERL